MINGYIHVSPHGFQCGGVERIYRPPTRRKSGTETRSFHVKLLRSVEVSHETPRDSTFEFQRAFPRHVGASGRVLVRGPHGRQAIEQQGVSELRIGSVPTQSSSRTGATLAVPTGDQLAPSANPEAAATAAIHCLGAGLETSGSYPTRHLAFRGVPTPHAEESCALWWGLGASGWRLSCRRTPPGRRSSSLSQHHRVPLRNARRFWLAAYRRQASRSIAI